ncbi:hypothetical protein Mycch_3237 [Mycolicibacterium chubuense NBB4]|uniref:Uncharacterized protein n=1 Tax=Mycolicibacterium chubuense (strain NBB4) TaxID=710421 RepID=I4BL28_MYCCN|nr:hypothetical protein Mycch_3237 [Mycolicibacterium chubuense NBB4]
MLTLSVVGVADLPELSPASGRYPGSRDSGTGRALIIWLTDELDAR